MNGTPSQSLLDQIDQCLPQTQCTLCTYPRCREYAEAIEAGQAQINQCPPGGEVTIAALAKLLDKPLVGLNADHGEHEPKVTAFIREEECIGCKLCIKACPVDCIIGAGKLMHTVISHECTGCKLCVPVCPTDCIDLVAPKQDLAAEHESPSPWPSFTQEQVSLARIQTEQKLMRMERFDRARKEQQRVKERAQMQQEIRDAIKRNSAKKSKTHHQSN